MTILPIGATDCHAHIFSAKGPFAAGRRYVPSEDAPIEAYLAELDRNHVRAGVLTQVSFLGTDNSLMLDAIARHPDRLRGVAVVDPTVAPEALAELAARGVRGLRLNLVERPVPELASVLWREHLAAAAAAGLHIEVQSEGEPWTHILPPLLEAGVTVVIDHFGRPTTADVRLDPGFLAVLEAMQEPTTWIKLSAPYRFRGDARRAAELILERAGADRCLWASDWPWTQHPEIRSYSVLKARLAAWVDDPRSVRAILEDNPRRLYWR